MNQKNVIHSIYDLMAGTKWVEAKVEGPLYKRKLLCKMNLNSVSL